MSTISSYYINGIEDIETFTKYTDIEKWNKYLKIYDEHIKLMEQYDKLYESTSDTVYLTKMNEVIEENKILKEKIAYLESLIHKQNIKINKLEITVAKQDTIINTQNARISELETTVGTQNVRIFELETTVNKLETHIMNLETEKLYNKYIVAIQDINYLDQLENKIPILKKLRRRRLGECHYIYDDDTLIEMKNRRSILLDKIQNIPIEIEQIFDKTYPSMLSDIIQYVAPNPVIVNKQDKEEINRWWTS